MRQFYVLSIAVWLMSLPLLGSVASATTLTSPAGATFTVSASCSITGNTPTLSGSPFTTNNTINDIAINQGSQNATGGIQAASFLQLLSVTCPSGTPWTVNYGSANIGPYNFYPVVDPNGNTAFYVAPFVISVDATNEEMFDRSGDPGITGVGTGAPQQFVGSYRVGTFFNAPNGDTAAQLLATPLIAGTYSMSSSVVVSF